MEYQTMMDISQFTREAMLRSGDIFDMQAAPFGAVTKGYGFTGDVVMLAGAYFDFLAVSDMAAHVGLTPVGRWEEVLKSAVAPCMGKKGDRLVTSTMSSPIGQWTTIPECSALPVTRAQSESWLLSGSGKT
jgi:hypothetical protein